MKIKYHIYKDYVSNEHLSEDEAMKDVENAEEKFKDRYSFVLFCPDYQNQKLYVGTTNFAGDILAVFDPNLKIFKSYGYLQQLRKKNEIKIHKGITLNSKDESLYFGTATVSDIPDTINDSGGQLVKYHIPSNKFHLIDTPTPGEYHQRHHL